MFLNVHKFIQLPAFYIHKFVIKVRFVSQMWFYYKVFSYIILVKLDNFYFFHRTLNNNKVLKSKSNYYHGQKCTLYFLYKFHLSHVKHMSFMANVIIWLKWQIFYKVMTGRIETFLITIAILEGRHYIWTNMDSAVIVKVDNKKRCTGVRRNTDAPTYNEVGLDMT